MGYTTPRGHGAGFANGSTRAGSVARMLGQWLFGLVHYGKAAKREDDVAGRVKGKLVFLHLTFGFKRDILK